MKKSSASTSCARPLARSGTGGRRPAVQPATRPGEVVMVMGLPGSGKSTMAQQLVADGYLRLNRDEAGGTLRGLVPALDRALASGTSRVVLDNTYVTRASRAPVIQCAAARGVAVRCVWLTTSVAERAGERRIAHRRALRQAARRGRDGPPPETRSRRVAADDAVPLPARARSAGRVRGLCASGRRAVRAPARSVAR